MNDVCHIEELLSAYLDGELRDGELDAVVEHLSECEDCNLEFRRLKEARTAVRLLPMLQVPDVLIPVAHYSEELSAYLDGELNTAEHQIVITHLESCTECKSELHELDSARTAIRALPGVELPEFLADYREDELTVRRNHRLRRVVGAAAGIAAAAALVFGLTNEAPSDSVDLDSFADRHIARASVEAGFSVIPAGLAGNAGP